MRHAKRNDVVRFEQIETGDVASDNSDLDLDGWVHALRLLPAAPVTEGDVLRWIEGPLRRFFPFEGFMGGYGTLSGGRIQTRFRLSSGHTPEYIASREYNFDLKTRGCFEWWVSNRKPYILDESGALDEPRGVRRFATRRSLEEIKRFSMGVVAAHGVVDPFVNGGTYIFFSGVPRIQPKRTLAALELIAPVLHGLMLGTQQTKKSTVDLTALTDRQTELVDLVLEGLPDKAIASRLAISDSTVGNHLRAIYAKLDISKRSQLIALLK